MNNSKLIINLGLIMLLVDIQNPVYAEYDNTSDMDCWLSISQEDKNAFMARHKERWQRFKEMTPEEREEFHNQWMAEKMEGMSSEQQEKFRDRMDKRKEIREKMNDMSPEKKEEIKARMEVRREMREKMQEMKPEERKAFREQQIVKKMENMTPEEQTAFRTRLKKREEISRKRCEAFKAELENR